MQGQQQIDLCVSIVEALNTLELMALRMETSILLTWGWQASCLACVWSCPLFPLRQKRLQEVHWAASHLSGLVLMIVNGQAEMSEFP